MTQATMVYTKLPPEIWLLVAQSLGWRDWWYLRQTTAYMRSLLQPKLMGYYVLYNLLHHAEDTTLELLTGEHRVDITVRDNHKMTVLHYAVRRGYSRVVRHLLAKPHDQQFLNAQCGRSGDTALIQAARHDKNHIAELLVIAGADINTQNSNAEGPLYWAIKRQNINLARLLVDKGADVARKPSQGDTPLISAIKERNMDLVDVLVRKKADIIQVDEQGCSALSCAVRVNSIPIVRILLDKGADACLCDGDKTPALIWAVMADNTSLVQILLDYGANPGVSHFGLTALNWAVIYHSIEVARLLLINGVDALKSDSHGRTALFWATAYGRTDIVRLLISHVAASVHAHTNC